MKLESAHIAPEIVKHGSSGATLRVAREKYGLTLEDVAAELRLSVYQIRALEEERYDDLPGETYVRGYLRAYSRLVDVDEELVMPHAGGWNDHAATTTGIHPVVRETRSSDRHMRLLSVIIVGVLLGLMYTWWQSREEPLLESLISSEPALEPARTAEIQHGGQTQAATNADAPEYTDQADAGGADDLLDQPALKDAGSDAAAAIADPDASENVIDKPKTEAAAESAAPGADTPPASAAQAAPIQGSAPAAVDNAAEAEKQPVTVAKLNKADLADGRHVVLRFSGTSWVDIRDALGERLLYQSLTAGKQITVKGEPPFKIFLGNADVVEMTYKGKPFDFSGFRSGIYARFELGK